MKYTKFLDLKKYNRDIIVPAFERANLDKIYNPIYECGNYSVLYECMTCGTREWKGFTRCKNKFCACCNAVKSLSWLAKTFKKFEQYLLEGKYIVMLTLTIRDRENLEEGLDVLSKAWKLFSSKDREISKTFKFKYAGGVKSLEVKTGENSGEWHPHLHVLLVKDRFSYDKAFLDTAWKLCIKRAKGIDDGKPITKKDEGLAFIESIYLRDDNGVKQYDREALVKGIIEAVKYISKFDYENEPTERLQELVKALRGVRQIDTFGCCKNIHKDVEEELNEEVKLEEVVEHACRLCGCNEAKLVQMFTDSIPDYLGTVLTDEMNVSVTNDEKLIEIFKAANGKRTWDGLIEEPKAPTIPKPTQASMFDDDIDMLDRLYYEATKRS